MSYTEIMEKRRKQNIENSSKQKYNPTVSATYDALNKLRASVNLPSVDYEQNNISSKDALSALKGNRQPSGSDEGKYTSIMNRRRAEQASSEFDKLYNEWNTGVKSYYKSYGNQFGGQHDSDFTELKAKQEKMLQMMDTYGRYWNKDQIAGIVSELSNGMGNTAKINRYLSQFSTEDDYNKAKIGWLSEGAVTNAETVTARKQRYQENEKKIAELEDRIKNEQVRVRQGNLFVWKPNEELIKQKEALEEDNTLYRRTQGVLDDYYNVTENKDFSLANRTYQNPTKDELDRYDIKTQTPPEQRGFELYDATGELMDEEYAIRNPEPVINDKLGMFLQAVQENDEVIDESVLRQSRGGGEVRKTYDSVILEGNANSWKQLTDDEIGIYYYLYQHNGKDAAYEYLDNMTTELNRRDVQAEKEKIEDLNTWEKIGYNALSVPASVFGGAVGFADDALNIIKGNDINPYSGAHAFSNFAQNVRGVTAEDLNELTNDFSVLGVSVGDAYQALMSGADSWFAAVTGLGGTGYGALMGMNAATSRARELYEQGASKSDIVSGSLLSGAAEMIFEKISLDKFLSEGAPKNFKQRVVKTLQQGGVEASEEMATEIANTFSDVAVRGSRSDFNKLVAQYEKEGYSSTDAKLKAFSQKALDVYKAGAGGFISGGALGGIGGAVRNAQYKAYTKQVGSDMLNAQDIDTITTQTQQIIDGSDVKTGRGIEKALAAVQENATAKAVGNLYSKISVAAETQNLSDIKAELRQNGVSAAKSVKVAEDIQSALNGFQMSDSLTKEINTNDKVAAVYEKLALSEDSSVMRRNQQVAALGSQLQQLTIGTVSNTLPLEKRLEPFTKQREAASPLQQQQKVKEKVSADGVTRDTVTGKPVQIVEVAAEKDGVRYLKTSDGGMISQDSVEYANTEEATAFEMTANMNPVIANAVIHNAADKDPTAYYNGMREGIQYIAMGLSEGNVPRSGFFGDLTESDQRYAIELGKQQRNIMESQQAEKAAGAKKYLDAKGNRTKRQGKVTFRKGVKAETKYEKAAIDMAKGLSKLGIDFEFYRDSTVSKKGKCNGYYDANGVIHINLDAGFTSKSMAAFTMSHELVHFIADHAPTEFRLLADIVTKHMEQNGLDINDSVQERMDKQGTTEAIAFEDAIADACESMLVDGSFVQIMDEVQKKSPGLYNRIKTFIENLIRKIESVLKEMPAQTQESAALRESVDAMREMTAAFTKGVMTAAENRSAIKVAETAAAHGYSNTEVKNSYISPMDKTPDKYTYEYFVSKPDMKVTVVDDSVIGQKSSQARKNIVEQAVKNAASVGFYNQNGNAVVHVDDIDTDITIQKNAIRHGLDRRFEINGPVSLKLGEILKNSIRINELIPRAETIEKAYSLIGIAKGKDNTAYPVLFVVNRHTNQITSIDVLYSLNAKKNQPVLSTQRFALNGTTLTGSIISISNLLEYVNRFFPDILPESVLKHFGHAERPEGSIGKNALYQTVNKETDVTPRTILSNALLEIAQNDSERSTLQQYQKKIQEAEQIENLIQEQNQILRKAFDKEARGENRRTFHDEQVKAKNRKAILENKLNRIDKELLRIEASKPLKDLLKRETQKAIKDTRKKAQESRAKNVEGRKKTVMKNQIIRMVNELNRRLLKGTKDKNIKIGMRSQVASALAAIDTNKIDTEQRLNSLKERMAKAKTQTELERLQRIYDDVVRRSEEQKANLASLQEAYHAIQNSSDPLLANAYSEDIEERVRLVKEEIGDTSLGQMSLEQLQAVYDMYRMVVKSVRDYDKSFVEGQKQTITQRANQVMAELKAPKDDFVKTNILRKSMDSIQKFGWKDLTPFYFFQAIGSKELANTYLAMRKGEDRYAQIMVNAKDYALEQRAKYHYDTWDFKKGYVFQSSVGQQMYMNLDTMLDLYTMSKREQAEKHLYTGGITYENGIKFKVEGKTYTSNSATNFKLSPELMQKITDTLTKEQRDYADAMVRFLSETMGEEGNKVSRKLYGIDLFNESYYVPLQSDSKSVAENKKPEQKSKKLKNAGFTKSTVDNANNPVVVREFSKVWANHVNEMSLYSSLTIPLEDFYRIYNYTTKTDANVPKTGVKQRIESAYGKAAIEYIDTLLADINGGVQYAKGNEFISGMISKFKKGAVMASLSVVIQQPTSIFRAFSLIDPKYFSKNALSSIAKDASVIATALIPGASKGVLNFTNHAQKWEELKQYAPIAVIKEMGSFDTGISRGATQWLNAKEYDSLADKFKAFFTDSSFRDDNLGAAAGFADEITWVHIWDAAQNKVAKEQNLSRGSVENKKAAAEIFNDCIMRTQVYDSVFSKSDLMRSQNEALKMATSFMAEPTLTANMLFDAQLQFRRGGKEGKRYAGKVVASILCSIVVNNLLRALIYAGRDDDEDKTFAEIYTGKFVENLFSDLNPFSYIPIFRDLSSLVEGYDVTRTDMEPIADVINAFSNAMSKLNNPDKEMEYKDWERVLGSIGNLFGIPAGNISRDIRGIVHTFMKKKAIEETTSGGILQSITEALPFQKERSTSDSLYNAIIRGDTEHEKRLRQQLGSKAKIQNAIRTALVNNDPRITKAAKAKHSGDFDEYVRLGMEIKAEGHFIQDDIVAAINRVINKLNKNEEVEEPVSQDELFYESTVSEEADASMYSGSDVIDALKRGDTDSAEYLIDEIVDSKIAAGKTEGQAKSAVKSSVTHYYKELYLEAYKTGDTAEMYRIEDLLDSINLYDDTSYTCEQWIMKYEEDERS